MLPYILLCCISPMINTFCLNYKNHFPVHEEQGYRSQYNEGTTGWMTRVSESDKGKKLFSLPRRPDRLRRSPVLFNSDLLPRGKAVVLDTDHSLPHSAEFMTMWSYIFTPPTCPYVLHRDNFKFTFAFSISTHTSQGTESLYTSTLTTVRGYRWQVGNYSDRCVSFSRKVMKDIICIQAEDSCCDYNPAYSHLRIRMMD